MNGPIEERKEANIDDGDLAHRTSAFQLACVAAPFVAAKMDTTKALLHAKNLLISADTRLKIWRNPSPTRDGFTAKEAVEEINRRARGLNLRQWADKSTKGIRPLGAHLREVVERWNDEGLKSPINGEHLESKIKEDFGSLWKKAQKSPMIDDFLIGKILDLRQEKEEEKQTKAAATRDARAAKRKRKGLNRRLRGSR
jgi:hypothetical protein